ncbi:hypothetical protein [Paenibacillus senegalensis]|nr:hypothetical protein [Paenibacillus senegalensis]
MARGNEKQELMNEAWGEIYFGGSNSASHYRGRSRVQGSSGL